MSDQLTLRRGPSSDHATFIGALGEVTFNTDSNSIVAHDGATVGGFPGGGFKIGAASSVVVPVAEKLAESLSLLDMGGVGDGVTSNQSQVIAALAAAVKSIFLPDGDFLVSSLTNTKGIQFDGPGKIAKTITGGKQQLNSYADRHQRVFGQEYLAPFHNLLISQTVTPTRKPIAIFSGDSTTYGLGNGVDADFTIWSLVARAATERGLQTPYGINVMNGGHPGWNTEQWRTGALAADLTLNPDLLVLRWGINDPGWLQDGTAPPLDAGQSYPNRRTASDYLASLRAGLATIRASRDLSSLSIVLMSPSSTSDTPNGRDEMWYEAIIPGIKQAARDFHCCFIDTYGHLRDSRPAANIWMDDPFADGRAIHPHNTMSAWIAGLVADVIFPAGLKDKIGRANLRNIGGAEDSGNASRLPSYYDYGITISRAATGYPLSGTAITVRSSDELCIQILYPFQDADRGIYMTRIGTAVAFGGSATLGWGAWITVGGASNEVAPATGYTIAAGSTAMRVAQSGNACVIEGFITKTTPAIVSAGAVVATIPVGVRPLREALWNVPLSIYTGTGTWEFRRGTILPDGTVTLAETTTGTVARIYANASWSLL